MSNTAKTPRFYLALAAGKGVFSALRLVGRNGGQLPGTVAKAICPDFLKRLPKPARSVFVTGTNGKTTASNLLDDILLANGFDLVTNRAGSNLLTGIESSLLQNATLGGNPRRDTACLELDELSCRLVLPQMAPEILVCVNLYRDSYMRNANPDYIFDVIDASVPASTHVILNADDLISCRLAPQATHRTYFSIGHLPDDRTEPEGIVCDLGACPECGGRLEYDWCHLRHLGHAHCVNCGFTNPEPDYVVTRVNKEAHEFTVAEPCHAGTDGVAPEHTYHIGTYSITNLYNLLAALVTAREMGIPAPALQKTLGEGCVNITASRFSEKNVAGVRLVNIASKGWNSTATSASLAAICDEPGTKVVALFIADFEVAKDPKTTEFVGWYYQVDFELLKHEDVRQVIILGDYTDDLMLRLRLAGIDPAKITVAADDLDAGDKAELEGIDGVYCAYDIHGLEQIERFRNRVAERLERQ